MFLNLHLADTSFFYRSESGMPARIIGVGCFKLQQRRSLCFTGAYDTHRIRLEDMFKVRLTVYVGLLLKVIRPARELRTACRREVDTQGNRWAVGQLNYTSTRGSWWELGDGWKIREGIQHFFTLSGPGYDSWLVLYRNEQQNLSVHWWIIHFSWCAFLSFLPYFFLITPLFPGADFGNIHTFSSGISSGPIFSFNRTIFKHSTFKN